MSPASAASRVSVSPAHRLADDSPTCAASWLTVTVLSRGTPESSATMAVMILVMEAMCDRSRAPREKSTVPSSSMTSA